MTFAARLRIVVPRGVPATGPQPRDSRRARIPHRLLRRGSPAARNGSGRGRTAGAPRPRRRRGPARGVPPVARAAPDRRVARRRPVRAASAAAIAGLRRRDRVVARSRDRRQHRHLQSGRYRAPEATPCRSAGSAVLRGQHGRPVRRQQRPAVSLLRNPARSHSPLLRPRDVRGTASAGHDRRHRRACSRHSTRRATTSTCSVCRPRPDACSLRPTIRAAGAADRTAPSW